VVFFFVFLGSKALPRPTLRRARLFSGGRSALATFCLVEDRPDEKSCTIVFRFDVLSRQCLPLFGKAPSVSSCMRPIASLLDVDHSLDSSLVWPD